MDLTGRIVRIVLFGSFVTCVAAPRVSAQALQSIRELYAAAAYEDALSAVTALGSSTPSLEAEQYRVFCLVALGRMEEADRAVESLLEAQPEYRPAAADASPRILGVFSEVRRRIGPGLVRQLYQQGRGAMERQDGAAAIAAFETMLRIADDPDVRTLSGVSELRELGAGFLDLSRATRRVPETATAPPAVPPAAAPADVFTPPVAIRQKVPSWNPSIHAPATQLRGAVRVQISPEGKPTGVELIESIHPEYDRLLLRAARDWRYRPALRNGVAIASQKTIEVSIVPPPGRTAGWREEKDY